MKWGDFDLLSKIQSRYAINVTNDDDKSTKIYCDVNNYNNIKGYNHSNSNRNITQCPTITRCLQLIEEESKNSNYIVNNMSKDEQSQILNHLSNFKHKQLEEQVCTNNYNCQSLQNIIDNEFTFLDQIHNHLCKHILRKSARNRGKDMLPFEHTSTIEEREYPVENHSMENQDPKFGKNLMLALIVQVIDNGFEKELMPVSEPNESITFDFNQWANNLTIIKLPYGDIVTILSRHYKIFDVVATKMKHPRHLKMRSPLLEPYMLSLILYTFSDDISHSLSCALRKRNYNKWCVLDHCLSDAIGALSNWENHDLFIYSGISGVEIKDADTLGYKINDMEHDAILVFQTYKSFSTSLRVAKEFAGDEGLIIAIKLCPFNMAISKNIFACDVSWISKYVTEREILAMKNSKVVLDPTRIYHAQ